MTTIKAQSSVQKWIAKLKRDTETDVQTLLITLDELLNLAFYHGEFTFSTQLLVFHYPTDLRENMKHTLYALLQRLFHFSKMICVQKKQPKNKAVETRQPADGCQYKYI